MQMNMQKKIWEVEQQMLKKKKILYDLKEHGEHWKIDAKVNEKRMNNKKNTHKQS